MSDQFKYAQLQPFTLAGAGVSIGSSTLVLNSFQTIDGTNLVMSNFGSIGFGTVDPGNGTREEQICWTGVTQNANGTATLTGVSSVSFVYPYTQTANFQKSHAGGAIFVVSNTSGFYDQLSSKSDDETITGKWTFPAGGNANAPVSGTVYSAPTDDLEYASKKYVDNVAIAGAPDASSTVKGITKLSSNPSVSTNPVALNSEEVTATPGVSKVVRADGSGKLPAGWGGSASGLATLDGSSKVVQDPANATATPTASKIPIATSGATLDGWISQNRVNIQTYVAGENIDASATPKAVYLKESDGRVYLLNATSATEAAYAFIGFAIIQSAVTTGNNISIQTDGVVSGFTGLTVGGFYYGTNTGGTISTTAGTVSLQVGRAVTATTLLIQVGKKVASGVIVFSSSTTSAITTGFKPARVIVSGVLGGSSPESSNGGWDPTYGNMSANGFNDTAGTSSAAWLFGNTGTSHSGTITSITSTGFTLSNTKSGAPANIALFWTAEG